MFNFFKKKEKAKLFYSTDVHSHMLPGVDHGATGIDNALELIHAQMDMGVNKFVFTPHITKTTFENTPDTINNAYDTFKKTLDASGLDILTAVSAEYRLDEFSLEQFSADQFLPMPNKYLLIENAYQQERIDLDEIIFNVQLKNFTPIMAHPERFHYYASRKQRFQQLHDAGTLFQVNLLSFAGYFGNTARSNAEWLLQNDMIDFLGSDIHNMEHAKIISDYIQTKDYRKMASKLEGRILNDTLQFN